MSYLHNSDEEAIYTIEPTRMRTDPLYIRVYILWMNLLLHIIGPFILLIVLNVRTYNKIKDFERTLNDTLRIRGEIQYTLKTPNENHWENNNQSS